MHTPSLKQPFHEPHQVRQLTVLQTPRQWQHRLVQCTIQLSEGIDCPRFLVSVSLGNLTLAEVSFLFNPISLPHLFSVR
jgi:hypothetical protein